MTRDEILVIVGKALTVTAVAIRTLGPADSSAADGQIAAASGSGTLRISQPTLAEQVLTEAPRDAAGTKRINIEVRRNESSSVVTGQVAVTGVSSFAVGELGPVEWSVSGQDLSGAVTSPGGSKLISFHGTVTATGVQGTFSAAHGVTGTWSWDGPIATP